MKKIITKSYFDSLDSLTNYINEKNIAKEDVQMIIPPFYYGQTTFTLVYWGDEKKANEALQNAYNTSTEPIICQYKEKNS